MKTEVGVIFIKLNMSWATVALALDEGLALAWVVEAKATGAAS